ncbi:MAG: prepilin-type N-terminal cleavage/methylation domain-containing protein [Thiogranum sp.]
MSSTQRGFTLIEMVLVIIIISVASLPLFGLFSQSTSSLLDNEAIQAATQLARERAEFVLARKRELGFNGPAAELAVDTTTETLTGNFIRFNRTTVITRPPAPRFTGCPGGTPCKQVTVSVDAGGPPLAQLTFLLVDY